MDSTDRSRVSKSRKSSGASSGRPSTARNSITASKRGPEVISIRRHDWSINQIRERGFNLNLCNLGGAHSESLENKPQFIRRTTNSTMPEYHSFHDKSLRKLKTMKAEANLPQFSVIGSYAAVSTSHILQLKKAFWDFSVEAVVEACRSEHCAAREAGVSIDRIHVIPLQRDVNLLEMVLVGAHVTNAERKLHDVPPMSLPDGGVIVEWLQLLDSKRYVDWPTYMLLCSLDLRADWKVACALRTSFDTFLSTNRMTCEKDFQALLSYLSWEVGGSLHLGDKRGEVRIPLSTAIPSFFQQGDFYRARHTCCFVESIICLFPHTCQFYVHKAVGRGNRMHTNFCGHTVPPQAIPTRPTTARIKLEDDLREKRRMRRNQMGTKKDPAEHIRSTNKVFVAGSGRRMYSL